MGMPGMFAGANQAAVNPNNQAGTGAPAGSGGATGTGAMAGAGAGTLPFGGLPLGGMPFGGMGMFNPYFGGQAGSVQQPVNYEEKYKEQLKTMEEMGFINNEANLKALIATAGNVELAIERMINLLG
jgi:ubiquilin